MWRTLQVGNQPVECSGAPSVVLQTHGELPPVTRSGGKAVGKAAGKRVTIVGAIHSRRLSGSVVTRHESYYAKHNCCRRPHENKKQLHSSEKQSRAPPKNYLICALFSICCANCGGPQTIVNPRQQRMFEASCVCPTLCYHGSSTIPV